MSDIFMEWLRAEKGFIEKVRGFIILFLIAIIIYSVNFSILECFEIFCKPELLNFVSNFSSNEALAIVVLVVIIEELLFRLPLALVIKRYGVSWHVIVSAVIVSVIFGCGSGYKWNIFFQVISGMFMCLLFIKCAGVKNNYFRALVATSIYHLVWIFLAFELLLVCHII